jgi:hypothetical protein
VTLIAHLLHRNREVIEAASIAEVREALLALCTSIEYGDFNYDKMVGIGIIVAASGHEGCEADVIEWLAESATFRRLDIVAALLNGLWLPSARHAPVDTSLLARLVALGFVITSSPNRNPDAEYSFALAIQRILEDERTSSRALRVAVEALNSVVALGTGNPVLDKQLASFATRSINSVLARAGAGMDAPDAPGEGRGSR